MPGDQILQIIGDWDVLGFHRTEEVLHDWVGVVSKADLDRAFKSMDVTVLGCPLVGLMLLHEWDKSLGVPSLHFEIVIIRSRSTRIHHEIDRRTTAENMGTRDDSTSAC